MVDIVEEVFAWYREHRVYTAWLEQVRSFVFRLTAAIERDCQRGRRG